jgi:cyclophilin family peptidyl-prolyl cis-trans isomerase
MRSKLTLVAVIVAFVAIAFGLNYLTGRSFKAPPQQPVPSAVAPTVAAPSPMASLSPAPSPSAEVSPLPPGASKPSNQNPDLTTDANGLSKATVVMTTTEGVVKFHFYPKEAPNTIKRMIELINKTENPNTHQIGFYNGLTFHRVIPSFIVQGGDPTGTGTGGSGQKLKAEFNGRHHVEGTLAMARTNDPDSADSQFYITMGTFPHLDGSYTVFGQVTEGMDVVKRLKVGDKIISMIIE